MCRDPLLQAMGGEPAGQLSSTIQDWLLMGFLHSSSSSGSPVMPLGARAAGCLCLVPESMWLQKWEGKHRGRMPGALKS